MKIGNIFNVKESKTPFFFGPNPWKDNSRTTAMLNNFSITVYLIRTYRRQCPSPN